ncbi:hypothetical protein [Sinomicrobium weinanense]|uniref:Uncharacterized protein n=1 Tax=Sinomicrobium weinanense TaxID=2842200 RepID=A0A926JU84_9FLAO|nr:hypothetical protein [Sinomicrobium weinanense]MBC9797286.1 hypothetical protein [Sinomicrobium weinanense]MBU3125419.1 hypothetical protein [Sinomicrobium weinanense]
MLWSVVLTHGCIPVKQAPRISEYRIERGVDIDKSIKTKKNIFIFQNRKRAPHFFNFISGKYKLKPHGGGKRFSVNLNDTDFDIFVFAPQISDAYLDFTGLTDEDENDPGYNSGDAYHYIAMRVSSEYEEDCLSLNSLQHNVVVNYLKELKTEYLSSL